MAENTQLESFKTNINLVEYASTEGYGVDKKESSRSSIVMRHGGYNDKIIITRGHDNHWIYFSVRDDTDNGSIIDFVQYRRDLTLGKVRQHLKAWVDPEPSNRPQPVIAFTASKIQPATKNRQNVIKAISLMDDIKSHDYLENERGISATVLTSPRFAGQIKSDRQARFQNVIFPHKDRDGLCGFEIKNRGFTGFASGGTKGLWFSNIFKTDKKLVITETAIDGLSFHCLNPAEQARYCSVGGSLNDSQPDLITGAVAKMPEGSEIIIATDADTPGRILADRIGDLAQAASREDIDIERHEPPEEGQDWNNQLCDVLGLSSSCDPKPGGRDSKPAVNSAPKI
ncbi:MAG: DUF3991 and TOPRIM domain-containing protein [Methylococcales bacterium]